MKRAEGHAVAGRKVLLRALTSSEVPKRRAALSSSAQSPLVRYSSSKAAFQRNALGKIDARRRRRPKGDPGACFGSDVVLKEDVDTLFSYFGSTPDLVGEARVLGPSVPYSEFSRGYGFGLRSLKSHIQSIQPVLQGVHLPATAGEHGPSRHVFISGSSNEAAHVFTLRLPVCKGDDGAHAHAAHTGSLVGVAAASDTLTHAGGMQLCGAILAVGTEDWNGGPHGPSVVSFFDVRKPAHPVELPYARIHRRSVSCGAVALTRLTGREPGGTGMKGRYLAIAGGWDSNELCFHVSRGSDLRQRGHAAFDLVAVWGWERIRRLAAAPKGSGVDYKPGAQSLNLLHDRGGERLWLVGLRASHQGVFDGNYADLYILDLRRVLDCARRGTVSVDDPALCKRKVTMCFSAYAEGKRGRFCNFVAAAGIMPTAEGDDLEIWATPHHPRRGENRGCRLLRFARYSTNARRTATSQKSEAGKTSTSADHRPPPHNLVERGCTPVARFLNTSALGTQQESASYTDIDMKGEDGGELEDPKPEGELVEKHAVVLEISHPTESEEVHGDKGESLGVTPLGVVSEVTGLKSGDGTEATETPPPLPPRPSKLQKDARSTHKISPLSGNTAKQDGLPEKAGIEAETMPPPTPPRAGSIKLSAPKLLTIKVREAPTSSPRANVDPELFMMV